MGFFFNSSNNNEDIDFESLRADLIDEYGTQMASFSGGLGFCDMCDAEDASNDELLAMAIIDLTRTVLQRRLIGS